jgi:hypothetical protein
MRWRSSFVSLVLAATATSGWAQSMSDAAQREKERRQKAREQAGGPARVVTGDDLKSNGGKLANDPSAASSSPAPGGGGKVFPTAPQPEAGESAARSSQESQWRSRARAAEARVERAQKAYDTLRSLYLVNGEYYADKNGRPLVTSAEQLQKLTEQAKAELDAAKKALDDLQESARRQSVPPGWLR